MSEEYNVSGIERSIALVLEDSPSLAMRTTSHMLEFAFGLPYGPHGLYPNPPDLPIKLYQSLVEMCDRRGWIGWKDGPRGFVFTKSENVNRHRSYYPGKDLRNIYKRLLGDCQNLKIVNTVDVNMIGKHIGSSEGEKRVLDGIHHKE